MSETQEVANKPETGGFFSMFGRTSALVVAGGLAAFSMRDMIFDEVCADYYPDRLHVGEHDYLVRFDESNYSVTDSVSFENGWDYGVAGFLWCWITLLLLEGSIAIASCCNQYWEIGMQVAYPTFVCIVWVFDHDYHTLLWLGEYGWFAYAKVFSVWALALVIVSMKEVASADDSRDLLGKTISLFLFINIMEAIADDFETVGHMSKSEDSSSLQMLGHLLGGISGIIVNIGVPWGGKVIYNENTKNNELHQNFGWEWVAAYSFWNVGFGFAVGSNSAASNIIHPLMSLLLPLWDNKWTRWTEYRVFSFNFHLMTRLLFTPFIHAMMNYTPSIPQMFTLEFIGFVVCSVYFYQYLTNEKVRFNNTVGVIATNFLLGEKKKVVVESED